MGEDETTVKIITLGNVSVGKTSILKKFVTKEFDENINSTIGMNIIFKKITLNNNEEINLKLIDTNGQEKYKCLSKQYYRNADGILFVFAHDNQESFNDISLWMRIYEESVSSEENVPKCLIGNKNDLDNLVSQRDINEKKKKNNDLMYESISAKTDDTKIDELFQKFGEIVYNNVKSHMTDQSNMVKLQGHKKKKKKKCEKCFD